MKIYQNRYESGRWKENFPDGSSFDWVLMFGSGDTGDVKHLLCEVKEVFPNAHIVGCSTAGEVLGSCVFDQSQCLTAIDFDNTRIDSASVNVKGFNSSEAAGLALFRQLELNGLKHLFILADGQLVNGSQLIRGLTQDLPERVLVTGGLAADGDRFEKTSVWHDDKIESGLVVAIALYGSKLKVNHGCISGWDSFGPERKITKSYNNVLLELDNQSALALYKTYLGQFANDLPASALFFPLLVREGKNETGSVRTILGVNEEEQSLVFAGDVPENFYAKLMRANFERVVDGAGQAASILLKRHGQPTVDLAILISCVGRRMLLKQRIEEEIELATSILGQDGYYCGFYSYGEISPFFSSNHCELHNQTMTITGFSEET